MKRLLTHAVAVWAGGFVALYWVMAHADAVVTRADILLIALWPCYVVQYVWNLI